MVKYIITRVHTFPHVYASGWDRVIYLDYSPARGLDIPILEYRWDTTEHCSSISYSEARKTLRLNSFE